jgi:hypothetical protein
MGNFLRIVFTGNRYPIDDNILLVLSRPLEEGQGDPASGTGGHRPNNTWISYGVGVAIALQLEFLVIDTARDVSGEDEQQVYVLILCYRGGM